MKVDVLDVGGFSSVGEGSLHFDLRLGGKQGLVGNGVGQRGLERDAVGEDEGVVELNALDAEFVEETELVGCESVHSNGGEL